METVIDLIDRAKIEEAKDILAKYFTRDTVSCPEVAGPYFSLRFSELPYEVFTVVFLDTRTRIITYEEMFRGTIDGSAVFPREVIRRTLHFNAQAVMFVHNHPSGVIEPSRSDIAITRKLSQALKYIDVRVLDHLVVGGGSYYSFAEHGDLEHL